MLRKIIAMLLSICIMICGTSVCWAAVINDTILGHDSKMEYASSGETSIVPFSNKFRNVKVYEKTTSGTETNPSNTRKCEWTQEHYKVYQENIGTGVRHFLYNEYKWSWNGYERATVNDNWRYVTSKSGTTRDQIDASDMYSFLMTI